MYPVKRRWMMDVRKLIKVNKGNISLFEHDVIKTKAYQVQFCTYFADSNSQLRITLSITYATNNYCKDDPCEGNLET